MYRRNGVLLINLGTPDDTSITSVRRYLRQFLSDPRVIDIPAIGRWLLLNLFILPFRPKQSAHAYKQIWTDKGSPLLINTAELTKGVAKTLGSDVSVRYAMRYQNPSIESALAAFREEGVERVIVVPLYPQYASSSTGTVIEELYRVCGKEWNTLSLTVMPPFYDHPQFIKCQATVAREHLGDLNNYDHFMMSFHGLPERHILKSELGGGGHCLKQDNCCDKIDGKNRFCYRAQAFWVARNLAAALGISEDRYSVTFQSRLGRTPWIQPYTDVVLEEMPGRGIKKLAVLEPSFTSDCLETLEEIGIRARETFMEAGGESLTLAPCLNANPEWIAALSRMIQLQGLDAWQQEV